MSIDRRQMILDRLEALLANLTVPLAGGPNGPLSIVPGNIVHNRNELGANKTPGIILLDADEVRDPRITLKEPGGIQPMVPPQIMRMTPEIYVVLDERGVERKNLGEDLNTSRIAILRAVLPDGELQRIVGSNGNIVYDGCVTDLARNRTMKGQLGISITFGYPLMVREYGAD